MVRQVEADGSSQHAASSPSSVGTAQQSPGVSSAEIILDSGADTSALPLTYADVGESCQHETVGQDFIDAQGGKLDMRDTRLATVDLQWSDFA